MLERMTRAKQSRYVETIQSEFGQLHQVKAGYIKTDLQNARPTPVLKVTPGADGVSESTIHTLTERSSASNLLERFNRGMPTIDYDISDSRDYFLNARSKIKDGRLQISEITVQGEGQYRTPVYKATYHPNKAMNIEGSTFSDLVPLQGSLKREYVEHYKKTFVNDGNSRSSPIASMTAPSGRIVVTDGHHRLAAALSLGRPVDLQITLRYDKPWARSWARVKIEDEFNAETSSEEELSDKD